MYILNDSNLALISIALFVIILIYIIIKYRRKQTYVNLRNPQWKMSFYWKFLLKLLNNNFDVVKVFSCVSKDFREKGYFSLNFIVKKWIFVFHPKYVQELLLDAENVDRMLLNIALKGVLDDSLLLRNGEQWRERKQFVNPCFRKSAINQHIPKLLVYSEQLIYNLNCKHNEWINIFPFLKRFTFEVTLGTALYYNGVAEINFTEITKLKNEITSTFVERIFNMFLWPNFIFQLTSKGRKFRKAIQRLRKIIGKVVYEKLKASYKIDNCVESIKNFTPAQLYINALRKKNSLVTIKSAISDFFLYGDASHESIANTLSWTLFELGKHPDIQRNIQNELDELLKNDIINNINTENLNKMQYLECVIKECLRMHPTVPITIRNSRKQHKFGNEVFSKNSIYFILIFILHRNAEHFPNPNIFEPSRFFPENSTNRHPYSFIPFSCGPRMCIGKYYAMIELKIFLAFIMKAFNIESFPDKCESVMKSIYLESKESRLIRLTPRISLN